MDTRCGAPLGKNQQRAGRTAITFPDLRNPLVEEIAFLAIIRLVCAGDKRRPALVLLHLVQFPEHPRHARVYLSVVILVTVIGVNRLTAGVRPPPLVPVIAEEIARKKQLSQGNFSVSSSMIWRKTRITAGRSISTEAAPPGSLRSAGGSD